jgi:hypothetical protein
VLSKYSCVEKINPLTTTQFFVKETDASTIHCEVDLNTTVSWRGDQFQMILEHAHITCPLR